MDWGIVHRSDCLDCFVPASYQCIFQKSSIWRIAIIWWNHAIFIIQFMSTFQSAPNWQVGAFGEALYLKWLLFKTNRYFWFPVVTQKMKNANTWITTWYIISVTPKHLTAPTVVLITMHYTNIMYYVTYILLLLLLQLLYILHYAVCTAHYVIDCLPLWCSPPRWPHRPHAWLARPADASPHKWWSAKEKYKIQIKHM